MGVNKKDGGSGRSRRQVLRENRLGERTAQKLSVLPGTSQTENNDLTLIVISVRGRDPLVVRAQLGLEQVLYIEGDLRIGRNFTEDIGQAQAAGEVCLTISLAEQIGALRAARHRGIGVGQTQALV